MVSEGADDVIGTWILHILPNMTTDGRLHGVIPNEVVDGTACKAGLGKDLMRAAIERAWRMRTYKIMLLTGLNRGAETFYERFGFVGNKKRGMVLRRACRRISGIVTFWRQGLYQFLEGLTAGDKARKAVGHGHGDGPRP
jgi:GNAT superfamily N-acetyltransferase